jgi:2-oxoglutarate ferredoxin oxidoreductase subunit alpha
MRIPGVWIIQQRGGPSTATVIYSQQETRLTALGGNGEGMRIVYSTASHQDLFDYTIKAFNSAWKYRFPTFVLGDGYQAKMREPLSVYLPKHRNIEMVKSDPTLGKPGVPAIDREPSHIRNTYNIEEELFDVLEEYAKDYETVIRDLTEWEQDIPGGKCDVLVVAHGIVSRAAHEAVKILSGKAIKAGYFRPITIRPFPADALKKALSENPGCRLLVVESAYGQLASMVKENLYGLTNPIDTLLKPGVGVTSDEIVQRLERSFVG